MSRWKECTRTRQSDRLRIATSGGVQQLYSSVVPGPRQENRKIAVSVLLGEFKMKITGKMDKVTCKFTF